MQLHNVAKNGYMKYSFSDQSRESYNYTLIEPLIPYPFAISRNSCFFHFPPPYFIQALAGTIAIWRGATLAIKIIHTYLYWLMISTL